jgi:hypothetical protein
MLARTPVTTISVADDAADASDGAAEAAVVEAGV